MSIKSTPKDRVINDEADRLYHLYNQDGVTPLDIIPGGVEFIQGDYIVSAVISARNKMRRECAGE